MLEFYQFSDDRDIQTCIWFLFGALIVCIVNRFAERSYRGIISDKETIFTIRNTLFCGILLFIFYVCYSSQKYAIPKAPIPSDMVNISKFVPIEVCPPVSICPPILPAITCPPIPTLVCPQAVISAPIHSPITCPPLVPLIACAPTVVCPSAIKVSLNSTPSDCNTCMYTFFCLPYIYI